ncbi:hypothetical protein [Jeotgalibacillus marinus]|uniref:Uncharacterized protein n=1 Tax=Jeotgalibacillus marinus TaxID=86667 RepID=A0ABV3Q0Y4_9BACL
MELIIMAIIAGIISMLNNQKKKEGKQEPKTRPTAPVSPEQSAMQERVKNARQAFDRRAKDLATEYDRQKAEIEQSKPRSIQPPVIKPVPVVELSRTIENPRSSRLQTRPNTSKAFEPSKIKKLSIKDGLQKKDLVNGIVLAEILGPPRSKKPHARQMTR